MKIGILLRGIAYGKSNHTNRENFERDFRNCAENFYEMVLNPLKELHEVKVYLCTYEHPFMQEMLETYEPEKTKILNFEFSNQITNFLEALELIEEEQLDFVLVMRFDMKYNIQVTDLGIDFDKVNFSYRLAPPEVSPWEHWQFVSDLAFYFPPKYINQIASAAHDLLANPPRIWIDLHGIYKNLKQYIKEDEINFLTDEIWQHCNSKHPIHEIVRTKISD